MPVLCLVWKEWADLVSLAALDVADKPASAGKIVEIQVEHVCCGKGQVAGSDVDLALCVHSYSATVFGRDTHLVQKGMDLLPVNNVKCTCGPDVHQCANRCISA